MAVSTDQYNRLLIRITRLEEAYNDAVTAMSNYVTVSQVNQLLTLLQQELDDVKTTLASLEVRVESIENDPLT